MISAVTFSGNLIGDLRFSMRLDTCMTSDRVAQLVEHRTTVCNASIHV